jgi:hypothetical protein
MTTAALTAARPPAPDHRATAVDDRVDLYWLPLGAGGRSVRLNGQVFEAIQAWREGRPRRALYHAALEISSGGARFVIEFAPVPKDVGTDHGAVVTGAVGSRVLGRFRLFNYELRCWLDGVIPDVHEAVASPLRLSDDPAVVRRLLERAPSVPALVWGRDELDVGEMWTSNSAVSWLLARSGLSAESVALPAGGRAPGWQAGIVAARREQQQASSVSLTRRPAKDVRLGRRQPADAPGPCRLRDQARLDT